MIPRWFRTAGLTLMLWLILASLASALDIDGNQVRWGFNGKVASNRFNLLSILVENSTPEPFEGPVILQKTIGDAPLVEVVSLAPFTSRWVQFYPYVQSGWEEWRLSTKGGPSIEVPVPRTAKYQRIILDAPTGLSGRCPALRPMLENLFPAFVGATDALQVVGLDHEPRTWIPAQKEAFLDWLAQGGTVLVLQGSNERFPEFTGPLSVLNSPLEEHRYGSGRILRVGQTRANFSVDRAQQVLVGVPRNYVAPNEKPEDPLDVVETETTDDPNSYGETDPFTASQFLSQMKDMTKPEHNWALLHFMFWIYIAMVFPGCYLLGKKWPDFRVVYGGLLLTVVLFSVLFSVVGQRGYGEATAVHSIAIAHTLPDGGVDVSEWSNVFVTSGADYVLRHDAAAALYSSCSETERVNGAIDNGLGGSFQVDIPPFSNREFASRFKLAAGAPRIAIEKLVTDGNLLSQLIAEVEGIAPANTGAMYALHESQFYSLNWVDNKLQLANSLGPPATVLKLDSYPRWPGQQYYGEQTSVEDRFRGMFEPLLARSLNVARPRDARQVAAPPGAVRFLVYARMPPGFSIQNERLPSQQGWVLYCIDVSATAP